MQGVINNISNISAWANGATGLLNPNVVNSLSSAINGLNLQQAQLVLSTKNLTQEQMNQVLTQAGLIASENTIQAELLQTTLAQQGLSVEKQKAVLVELGLMNSQTGELLTQKACTKEDLEAILAQKGITGAQAEGIISALGLTGANTGLAFSFDLLAKTIWKAVKGMIVFLATNPVGWAILAVGGIVALTKVVDELGVTVEEQREELDTLKQEYSKITSELESLNSELSTTEQRMRELEKIESPTFAEKEEYDNLVETNNELQRKIDLLELEEKIKSQEARDAFVSTMEKDTNRTKDNSDEYFYYIDPNDPYQQKSLGKGSTVIYSMGGFSIQAVPEDELIDVYENYANRLKELDEQYANDLENETYKETKATIEQEMTDLAKYLADKSNQWSSDANGIKYIQNPTTEDDKAVNEWLDYIADFQDRMSIVMGGDNAKTNTFNRLVDNWQFDDTVQELQDLGAEGKVTAEMLDNPKYDDFINKLVEIGVIDSADDLDLIALAFNGVAFEAENAADAVSKYGNEITVLSITDTVDAIHTKLKPAMDSLADAYAKMFTDDGFTHDGITTSEFTGIKSALDEMKESGLEIDYEEYESFVKVLSDVNSTSDDVDAAFDSMATMMVNASGVVDVTEENFNLLKQQLEELGVTNAEEVLTNIRNIQNELANSGINLTEVTYEEAGAFLASAEAESIATEYLRAYMFQKALADNPLNTAADIEALEELCGTLGIAGEYLEKLAHLKYLYASADAGGIWSDASIQNEIAKTKAELDSIAQNEYQYKVDFDFDGNVGGSGSGSGSGSEFDWSDMLDKEIKLLEKQLDAGLIDFDTYLDKRLDLINQYYNEGKIAADEYYAYLEDTYDNQISIYDKVINAVTKKLNDQIEDLEKQKEVIEESYQLQIDKIQTEIDLLQEEADKKQDLIDLEKARYEAERARTQRSLKLYNGEQFIYTNDPDAVRDAEEELADRELQFNISTLEEKIEALEKEMNDATSQIDEQIKHLQEYIDQWSEVADAYEDAQNEMMASQILGANWEKDVLAMRQDVLNQFRDNYIQAQQDMADAAWRAAEAQIKAAQEAAKGVNGTVGSTDVVNNPKGSGKTKTVHVYNGKEYSTPGAAERARDKDATAAYNKALTSANYNGMPSDVRKRKAEEAEAKVRARSITPKVVAAAKGGVIGKDDDFLSSIAKSVGEDTMVAAKEGERILTPLQNENFEKLISIADQLVPVLIDMPFANLVNKNLTPAIAGSAPVNLTIGDIHLHEVQDVDTFSKAIINQFPGRVIQAIKK